MKIDPILRDIRPPRPVRQTQGKPREPKQASKSKKRFKLRFPQRLIRSLFILALAILVLVVSVSSARFLIRGETGQSSFGELKNLVGALVAISSDLNKLESEGLNFALNGKGEELIALLKSLQINVAKLDSLGVRFIEEPTLKTANEGLRALIGFLDQPGEKRLLVLFLNPSEMRPIGGFSGSYGVVTLERGSIKDIKVNDIYYPDRFLTKKIVPPRELQSVTIDWGARDAAWFFDFPASAGKTMELLEASDVYTKENIHFDGVIALNVRVMEDILALTGPVEIKEYNLTLTKDNFLEEVQKEVEVGRDKQAGENPKRVLGALTPVLIESLNKLDGSDKNALLLAFWGRAANKDIQFYFKDPQLEDFVRKAGWAGEVAALGSDGGDYLAVVNTNVAGGKTDARIEQKINLKSEISAGGRVNNHLVITRHHFGKENEAPWYRSQNQNFIRIYTPAETELVSLAGVTSKIISPRIDYDSAGYSRDPLLAIYEKTQKESGKNIFSAWFSVLAGQSRNLEVNYKSSQLPLADKMEYRFIIDTPSGVESAFHYDVPAPGGYRWLESRGSTFGYKSETIPARLTIDLTLVRD